MGPRRGSTGVQRDSGNLPTFFKYKFPVVFSAGGRVGRQRVEGVGAPPSNPDFAVPS